MIEKNENGDAVKYDNKSNYGFNMVKIISEKQKSNARTDLLLGSGGDSKQNIREFVSVSPSAGNRRYVHQFRTFFDPNPSYTQLYFYIILEWRGCCNWQTSSQQYYTSYDLNVSGYYSWYGGQAYFPTKILNGSGSFSYGQGFLIAGLVGGYQGGGWYISVNGTVYQIIDGDVINNGWTDTW